MSLPREMEVVLHHGLCIYHRGTAMITGGKWVNRASLVERTVRAKKRQAENSFQSWCMEGGLVGQDQMDHGSDRLGLGDHRLCSEHRASFRGWGGRGLGIWNITPLRFREW